MLVLDNVPVKRSSKPSFPAAAARLLGNTPDPGGSLQSATPCTVFNLSLHVPRGRFRILLAVSRLNAPPGLPGGILGTLAKRLSNNGLGQH